MEDGTRQKQGFHWRWGWIIAAGILVLFAGGITVLWMFSDPWKWSLNRHRYEGIVRKIKALGVPTGEERHFRVSSDKDPATLRPIDLQSLPPHELYHILRRGEIVDARRKKDGRLVVQITALSRPHAGTYGLVYCSGYPDDFDLTHGFGIDGRYSPIADHWWAVVDRSD